MRLTPAEQIEQSYDLAMMALADYLTHERDATATIDALIRITASSHNVCFRVMTRPR
ncbi:hypothetical protein IVB25_20885 [Bradyrhizobium sp. 193]|uniref:hypothetical protein n=1 Tax=Bradyrhizobium sp. 193 TaxID=2782661 RepID=UPI001FF92714|nr:hypothetical protein [Bradyrhizobium sp. 193]MCK1485076.1 hypothetical protein [Bradyrhizobium sp. 193]